MLRHDRGGARLDGQYLPFSPFFFPPTMLDISFSEIAVIGAVALVVLGPERLPKVARTAGHLFGRLQRYVNGVKADIAREMEASELSSIKQEVQNAARAFEKSVHEHSSDVKTSLEAEAKSIQTIAGQTTNIAAQSPADALTSIAPPTTVPISPSTTANGASMLGSGGFTHAEGALSSDGVVGQGLFDFGIEPVRSTMNSRRQAPKTAATVAAR